MLAAGCAVAALALGVPPPVVAFGVLALWQPWWCGAAALAWAGYTYRRRSTALLRPDAEADFLRGLATELEAGASLRSGVVAAAQRVPSLHLGEATRLAAAGMPADRIGAYVGRALPVNGRLAAAAFRLAAASGGRVATLIHALAARAAETGRLRREESALTAQARASAWLVGGAPLLMLAGLLITGRAGRLISDPAGPVVLSIGLAFEVLGVTTVWAMLRKARR